MIKGSNYRAELFFIHEKVANSILTKSGLKHLVAVTPSIIFLHNCPHNIMKFTQHIIKLRHKKELRHIMIFIHNMMTLAHYRYIKTKSHIIWL